MKRARELGAYKYIECFRADAASAFRSQGAFDDSIRCVLDAMKKPKKKKAVRRRVMMRGL